MESAKKTFLLDQSSIQLSKAGGRLLILVEAVPSQKVFSIELDNDAVVQASNKIFADVESMEKGLEEALNKVYKEVTISVDGNGKLTYSRNLAFGGIKTDHQFTITLQEKDFNSLTTLESKGYKLEKLEGNSQANAKEVGKNEVQQEIKTIAEMITQFEKKVFDKFQEMEKKITMLEQLKVELPHTFDPSGRNASSFTFLDHNRTIRANFQRSCCEIPIAKSLPQAGKLTLTFKLEKIDSQETWIGLMPTDKVNSSPWHQSAICYNLYYGHIAINGTYRFAPKKSHDQSYGVYGKKVMSFR